MDNKVVKAKEWKVRKIPFFTCVNRATQNPRRFLTPHSSQFSIYHKTLVGDICSGSTGVLT